jgi:hypothetical protein
MATSLDELLKLKGVIIAGEFSSDGKLVEYHAHTTHLPQDVLDLNLQPLSRNCLVHWQPRIRKSAASIGCPRKDGCILGVI